MAKNADAGRQLPASLLGATTEAMAQNENAQQQNGDDAAPAERSPLVDLTIDEHIGLLRLLLDEQQRGGLNDRDFDRRWRALSQSRNDESGLRRAGAQRRRPSRASGGVWERLVSEPRVLLPAAALIGVVDAYLYLRFHL
jgi:hypothetical protein